MNLSLRLALLFFLFSCSAVSAGILGNTIPGLHNPASAGISSNSITQSNNDTVVIRFEYKQSALYHSFTFEVLDSIIGILLKNKAVTLSIDGYAYKDEGSDTICYYLSLNRALFIQTYILGRGVDSSRIASVTAYGRTRAYYQRTDKDGLLVNCRAELSLKYPPSLKKIEIQDRDEDGVIDSEDKCPDVFGYKDKSGCPNTDMVIVPFETQLSNLYLLTYKVLDSVLAVLSENPSYTIAIEGHAYKDEGISSICDRLASERATIVKNYLLSRRLNASRINSVKSYGNSRPLNAGKTHKDAAANSRAEIVFDRK